MSNKAMLVAAAIATAIFSTNAGAQGTSAPTTAPAPQGATSPTVGTSTAPPVGTGGAGPGSVSGVPSGPANPGGMNNPTGRK